MNFQSIRWRLPFSYAAIAFLAALSLGSVMLLVLHGHYARQEREYLMGNATALQPLVEAFLQSDLPDSFLQEQFKGLSFLSQARIRILDEAGKPLVDSGIPDPSQVVALSGGQAGTVQFSMPVNSPAVTSPGFYTGQPGTGSPYPPEFIIKGGAPGESTGTRILVSASPYGYAFTNVPIAATGRRSAEVVELPLSGKLGTLEISAGPAYGWEIVRSVSLAWVGASGVAILLAALAGWYSSRQVTRPVLALTGATRQMEGGNLAARVVLPDKRPAREFAALAHSFNSMAQKVEDTVSTLRAFVADAAHELHTPLTALHTNLELASGEGNANQRFLYLERAQEQSVRLEALVSGLLDLSRIEAGRTETDIVQVDVNRLVEEVGESFASRAEQAERDFSLQLPEETVSVNGNPAQLRRIITNLLENSLKFTPAGGSISLELGLSGREAVLMVTDSGIGVPEEDLPQLFERFHRGRNASAYPGSGLGLAIVRALVTSHGGRIHAESEAVRGTRMTVNLPICSRE